MMGQIRRSLVGVFAALWCALVAACGSPSAPTPIGPRVTGITPTQGTTFGGTNVTISGTNFAAGATVSIGGVPATDVALQSATAITATTPPHAAGSADVIVTVNGRSGSLPAAFTYVAAVVNNQPPTLTSLVARGTREHEPAQFADMGEAITVTATVQDNETPVSALTFEWSADAGSFSGSGPSVTFTAPRLVGRVTVRLKITERYTAPDPSGLPVQKENTTFGATVVSVHDSENEILDLGEDFLTLFTHSEVSTDQVLHNFSTTCDGGRGRASEAEDVDRSRRDYVQDFSKFRIRRLPPVQFRFGGVFLVFDDPLRVRHADASSQFAVHWEITYIRDVDATRRKGTREITDGIDNVTAVLESDRWRLCASDFKGTSIQPTTGIRRTVIW
jgi:hypothetical protein